MRFRTLPLGVDIGTARLRIAFAERNSEGAVRLRAIAGRDLPDGTISAGEVTDPELLAASIEEIREELGTRERRCVCSIGASYAVIRSVAIPPMTWTERLRAARFEARRFAEWSADDGAVIVRVHREEADTGRWLVGTAKRAVVESRVAALRVAGLRPIAIDHDALALRRAHPQYDAVVDVGLHRSTLHVYASDVRSIVLPEGGTSITHAIARALSIDELSAERRKRILGCAGAAVAERDALAARIRDALERTRTRHPVARLALTGNGARLPGLAAAIEAAAGCAVDVPVSDLMFDAYPGDVLRAAAPDWSLAAGIASWTSAA